MIKKKCMYKYYIMSKQNKHALGVIEETDTTITVQNLKVEKLFNPFANDYMDEIVADYSIEQVNNAVLPKDDLSIRMEDVDITKDYWTAFEYLTERKRKSVSENTEC